MTLASLEEQTWLLVLGDSVFRGIFLTLVDMVLGKGQKANIKQSVLQKCWGYADVQVGSLRVTYQVPFGVESIVWATATFFARTLKFGFADIGLPM